MPARPTKNNCTVYSIRDLPLDLYEKMKAAAHAQGLTTRAWLLMILYRELGR